MKLKQIRKQKNITQKELAQAIGVDTSAISKFEKGALSPSTGRVRQLAEFLGVTIDDLLDDKELESFFPESSLITKPLTESEILQAKQLRLLDEIGISAVKAVIESQINRCNQRFVNISDEQKYFCCQQKSGELFCNPKTPLANIKTRELQSIKRKSCLNYSVLQRMLALRGYNSLISIQDLILIFHGDIEPCNELFNDIFHILEMYL